MLTSTAKKPIYGDLTLWHHEWRIPEVDRVPEVNRKWRRLIASSGPKMKILFEARDEGG